jgi:multidrug efflux system membrane fusion protein
MDPSSPSSAPPTEPLREPEPLRELVSSTPSGRARWGVRIGLGIVVVAIVLGIVGLRLRNQSAGGGGGPGGLGGGPGGRGGGQGPAPVRTIHPELRDVPIHLEALGTVTPRETAVVRARVSGQLERILFTEGQDVHAGDVLAELDARPFRVALAEAQAVLARDQASLAQARATHTRGTQLHAHELISTQDLEAQAASVATLEATTRADRAAVDRARLDLTYARVVSPIDGQTGLRQVDPGNLVSSADANGIVVVTRVDPIDVVFTVPQDELGAVRTHMQREPLVVEVVSREAAQPVATGRLTVIDNRVDTATGTVRMKAEVPNDTEALWPNQLVEVRMLLETRRGALVVPDASVQQGPEGSFVYVIVDHRAVVRPVRIERIVGELAIVAEGLTITDEVVSEGHSRLRPDAEVRLEGDPPPGGPGAAAAETGSAATGRTGSGASGGAGGAASGGAGARGEAPRPR